MSTEREPRLPDRLGDVLGPHAPLGEGLTILLLTISSDGYPHQAMLSCGEVVAVDDERLALAVWPTSTAARNLAERPRATLALVDEGTSWCLFAEIADVGTVVTPLSGTLCRFDATITRVTSDRAPYAVLESGVTFQLTDPEATTARWRELRAAIVQGGRT